MRDPGEGRHVERLRVPGVHHIPGPQQMTVDRLVRHGATVPRCAPAPASWAGGPRRRYGRRAGATHILGRGPSRGRTPAGHRKGDDMARRITIPAVAVAAAALIAAAAVPAVADDDDDRDRICRGAIGAVPVDDDIRVPAGARCVLNGTRVDGDVVVARGARLVARGARIDGDIAARRHRGVVVVGGVVDGDVDLRAGGTARITRVRIEDDLVARGNRGIQRFRGNRIGEDLRCRGNRPAPTGGGNRVAGLRSGQCRLL